ncbi:hypothetical protein [Nocardioides panacisoli]|uniref:Uncharacterized protein n=1 Tax=Nocardioides panacisoli TaxID=627624 RepID=A0ABP7HVF8_9ACTN
MEDAEPTEDPYADLAFTLRNEGYKVERPQEGTLLVEGRFLNPERIALQAAGELADGPGVIWAISAQNDWTLVAWSRPDLVTITQRGTAPPRWRHRRLPPKMGPAAQTFLEGGASPHDIVTKPKHRPTDAAREVLAGLGLENPEPPGWVPPPPPVVEPVVSRAPVARRSTTPRAPRAPKAPARPAEPAVKVCPTCFMALPATGICDNCG